MMPAGYKLSDSNPGRDSYKTSDRRGVSDRRADDYDRRGRESDRKGTQYDARGKEYDKREYDKRDATQRHAQERLRDRKQPYDRSDRDHYIDNRTQSRGTTPPEKFAQQQAASKSSLTPPAKSRPTTPVPSSNFLAELVKQGKSLLAVQTPAEGVETEALEQGEIQDDSRKRKHSPIIWQPPEKQARVQQQQPASLLDRVAEDVEEFRRLTAAQGFDPDAPAAMKSSPSVSGEEAEPYAYDSDAPGCLQDKHARHLKNNGGPSSSGGDEEDMMLEAKPVAQPQLFRSGMRMQLQHQPAAQQQGQSQHQPAAQQQAVPSRWLVDTAEEQQAGSVTIETVELLATEAAAAVPISSDDEGLESSEDEEDSHMTASARSILNIKYNMLQECRSVDEYEKISRISEGTYGVVYKAREKATGKLVALKRVKMEKEHDGFPVTSIREINILLNFHHPNIVNVSEVVMGTKNPDHIFMVMELMDHDLKSLMEDKKQMTRPFSVAEVKCLMQQLLAGIGYLHSQWVLHRDIKTSNILYNNKGELKICDFGLARQYGSPLRTYTHQVVTLWYRAPELLFGARHYSTALDVWSVGCVMGELLLGQPMFPGQKEWDTIDKIIHLLGTPTKETWPGFDQMPNYGKIVLKKVPSQLRQKFQASYGGGAILSEAGFDLLTRLLAYDPGQRISADEALQHRWFSESPLPQKKELMPTFAARTDSAPATRHGIVAHQ